MAACRSSQGRANRSATSRAEPKRSAGFLACSRVMASHSHCGMAGLISRMGRGSVLTDALEHGQAAGGAEGRLAGTHHVQHAAQAEQVGTVVDGFVLGLLGRHVQRRAGNVAGLGRRRRRPPAPARNR